MRSATPWPAWPGVPAGLPAERDAGAGDVWRADVGGTTRRTRAARSGYREQRWPAPTSCTSSSAGRLLDDDGFAAWDETFEADVPGAWARTRRRRGPRPALAAGAGASGALSNASVAYQTAQARRGSACSTASRCSSASTRLGFGKPDPRVFLEACRRLGTAPERTAYVGDELDVDAVAARAAGLLGVWVDRPGARRLALTDAEIEAADVVAIESLDQLPAALGL